MIITVDTGGTKTLVTSYTLKGGKRHSVRFLTPGNQLEYYALLLHTLKTEFATVSMKALSVAVPGLLDGTVVARCGNLPWHNFDLVSLLQKEFSCPIFIGNDAKLAALGEARALPVKTARCLYITISTGIGTGFVVDGQLVEPLSSSEAGHMILERNGVYRTWESFASGRAIRAAHGKYAADITSRRAWKKITADIARGVDVLIPIFLPDYIVIGGSIGTHFDRYGAELAALVQGRLSPLIAMPHIVQATHPEEAVAYGCYHYAIDRLAAS